MFCMNNVCNKRTFAEKHPFTNTNGKTTNRLERNVIYASTQLSAVGASKTLKSSGINICKSSMMLMKQESCIVRVCR